VAEAGSVAASGTWFPWRWTYMAHGVSSPAATQNTQKSSQQAETACKKLTKILFLNSYQEATTE